MAKKRQEIARLDERSEGGTIGILMFIFGCLVIMLLIVNESSAIRLAAWGAIWTGWNVISASVMFASRRISYVVTRESAEDE